MNKKEEVILLKDLKNVGRKGEVKLVNSGFASNFLFPNGNALPHNEQNAKKLEVERLRTLQREQLKLAQEEELFAKIDNTTLLFYLKKEGNKTFGSIGLGEINKELQKQGFPIQDKKKFTAFSPLNSTGTHTVHLRINKNLVAQIKVVIDIINH